MKSFVGERRALASIVLVFYAMVYGLMALSGMLPPEWTKAMGAMGGVYGLAFFSLVAGYFWARWFALGVALSGVITGVVSLWQVGPEPVLLFVGGSHLLATVMLWGQAMAGPFDGQTAWRQRFHIDEHAAQRLGKAIIRAGVSLPYILLYALAPKPDAAQLAVLALTGVGMFGLLRLRTWGVLALAGATGLLATAAFGAHSATGAHNLDAASAAAVGAIALGAATAPWLAAFTRRLVRA
jgi:hypothetical protein